MSIDIVDVSAYQHPNGAGIDWAQVKAAGVRGVIVKATEGVGYTNPYFTQDVAGASAAGLAVIAYHFAGWGDPYMEADFFKRAAGWRARVLDSETNSNASWQNTFLAALGLKPGQEADYGSASTLPSGAVRALIWAAAYGPMPHDGETFWQFTSGAHVPGIQGTVDASEWLGTQAQFDALFGITPQTQGDTMPAPTDVVDSFAVPGGTPSADHFDLHADGGLFGYGKATAGQIDYVAVASDGSRYRFSKTATPGIFPAYTALPATAREGTRYFVRMEVVSYNGVPAGQAPAVAPDVTSIVTALHTAGQALSGA